nr:transglutaminase-like domain-containing protein [Ramlibacter pallidus]
MEDPKLRLRVHALTQLCKNDREKALSIYGYVKRLPLRTRMKFGAPTARQVYDAGHGDAFDKATLLVAMLRMAGLPSRVRFLNLGGEILRGIPGRMREAVRPVLEIWLQDQWLRTDTFIYDGECMAAARQRLKDLGWEWGYGIHVNGAMVWNGYESAFLGGVPTECDLMVLEDLGVFHDPLHFATRSTLGRLHASFGRLLHWNLLAPLMDRAWRKLRDSRAGGELPFHKTS